MKRELQFVNSMIKKLKTQGDISKEEATRMFVLATVIYAYGMGQYKESRFWDNFNYKFDFSELSDAIGRWYKEVLLRIPDKISGEYHNFIASIPSAMVCPPPESSHYRESTAPRLRDIHEYLLVFVKDFFSRPDKGVSDINKENFVTNTLSIWKVKPESARRIGHPAPFPLELAKRVISLYSYAGDAVLDPFAGSGTTLVAAKEMGRTYVGYEIEPKYCEIARERLENIQG